MSKFKRLIAGISAAAVVTTQALSAVVYGASGISDPEFDKALSWMYTNGLTKYNTSDAFRPYDTLTREQAAKFYSEFAKKILGSTPSSAQPDFTDLKDADATLSGAIVESFQLGLFKGTNGKFFPTAPLTKAQSLAVLVRAMSGSMDENVTPWWKNYFQKARELGLTKETDVNALDRSVTRYEIALMLYRASGASSSSSTSDDIGSLLNDLIGDNGSTDSSTSTGSTSTSTGSTSTSTGSVTSTAQGKVVEVALDPNTPKNQYVPGTGSQIKVMKLDFMAGSSDVAMKALTVKLEGMSTRSKVSNVYLVDKDGQVVTSQRTFNTDYVARLVFNNNYKISANQVAELYVAVDLTNAANELYTFSIPSTDSVEADVDVTGSFPITSYTTQGTSYSSQVIKFYSSQSTSNTTPTGTVYVGDTNKEVMRFTLEMPSGNNRNVSLKSITLKANNNIENVIDNVQLLVGGTNIAKSVVIDNRTMTITTDFQMTYGSNKVFTVFADVVGGENNRNDIQLYLNQSSDIVAIESETNAATSIDTTTYNKLYGNYYTLKEGDNLISKSSDTPTATNIPSNQKDILALAATVNFPNPIKTDKIRVYFTGTSIGTSIDKLRLYVNDKFIDEASSFTASGTMLYATFNYYDVLSSSTSVKVKINTQVNATAGASISAITLDASSIVFAGNTAQFQTSQNNVIAGDIKGSAVSPTYTVATPSLQSVQRNDGLTSNETIVAGVQGLRAVKFTVQNNNVRDLTINGFTVTYSGASANSSYLSNLKVGTGTCSSSSDCNIVSTNNFGGGSATFTSLNIPVTKGSTNDITLLVDVGSGFPAGGSFQLSVANFDVQDNDANTVTVDSTTTTGLPTYSSTFTVGAGGILYLDRDTGTPKQRILAGNPNVEQEVARFKFKSTKDDSTVQELSFGNIGTGTLSAGYLTTANSGSVSSRADNIISALYIYNAAGTKLGSATMVNGYAHFSFSTGISLTRETDVVLYVKAKISSITDVSLSNIPLNLALVNAGTANSIGVNKTKIVSASNGNEVSNVNYGTNVYGNSQILRATTMTLASVSQTSTSIDGTPDMYAFSVTADAAKQATVKEVHVDVNVTDSTSNNGSTGFNVSNFKLYINGSIVQSNDVAFYASAAGQTCSSVANNAISNGTPTLTGGVNTSQSYCLSFVLTGQYVNGYNVTAGTTVPFRINAQTSSSTQNDQISSQMKNISSDSAAYTYAATSSLPASIIWADNSANTVSPLTSTYWFTDTYLDALPINPSWTLTK